MGYLRYFLVLVCVVVLGVGTASCGGSIDAAPCPEKVDHLVYAVP